jgi:hypothetical protein
MTDGPPPGVSTSEKNMWPAGQDERGSADLALATMRFRAALSVEHVRSNYPITYIRHAAAGVGIVSVMLALPDIPLISTDIRPGCRCAQGRTTSKRPDRRFSHMANSSGRI